MDEPPSTRTQNRVRLTYGKPGQGVPLRHEGRWSAGMGRGSCGTKSGSEGNRSVVVLVGIQSVALKSVGLGDDALRLAAWKVSIVVPSWSKSRPVKLLIKTRTDKKG